MGTVARTSARFQLEPVTGVPAALQTAERSAGAEEDTWPAQIAPADVRADTESARQDAGDPSHRHRRQGEHPTGRLERSEHAARLHTRRAVCRRRVRNAALPVRLSTGAEMLPRRQESQIVVRSLPAVNIPLCSCKLSSQNGQFSSFKNVFFRLNGNGPWSTCL